MKKMFPPLAVALSALSLFAALVTPAGAQAEGFTETFDDPALPGWEHSPNSLVEERALRIGPGGFAFRPGPWSDLALEISVRFLGPTALEIAYSTTDRGEYVLRLESDVVSLRRADRELARSEVEIVPVNEWTRILVTVIGGSHEILRNGRLILQARDGEPLPPGGLILRVAGPESGEFDNLILKAGGAQLATPTAAETRAATTAPSGLPAYQAGKWLRLGGPPGGLGYDIRMRPDNPDVMYVTDAFTGIFRSTDGGQSWSSVNQGIETSPGAGAPIFCATVDPHDHDAVWTGTQLTGHIYRSIDRGDTWERRDNGLIFEDCLRSVRGITVDPNDPDIVYAGLEVDSTCWAGKVVSRRQGVVHGEVYKSTDGGGNWTRIWEGENLARYIWVDPRDSERIYVSTGIFDRDAANSDIPNGVPGGVGILRSDDGGNTWEVLGAKNGLRGLYIPSLFMHPENPGILLAAVTSPALTPGEEGVYVTNDGGDTWQKSLGVQSGLSMDAVEVSISDPDVWYAATENAIYRSDDAGQAWQQYRMVAPDRVAGMPIDLQVDPRDPHRIFVNSYNGGNLMSTDGGETWQDASHGYTGLRVHAIGVAPGGGQTLFANEFRSDDGGQTWRGTQVAGRAFVIQPARNGKGFRIVVGALYGAVAVSEDAGQTWLTTTVADTGGAPLSVALVAAPTQPDTLYLAHYHWNCGLFGVRGAYHTCFEEVPGIYRSDDGGHTWQAVGSPVKESVLALAVDPKDPEALFAGTASGLFRSSDGGQTWKAVQDFSQATRGPAALNPDMAALAAPLVADVLFDPYDARTLFVASRPGAVLRSQDGGLTWEQVAAGMDPNEPVTDLLADPNRQSVFYAASSFSGVLATTDGGDTWQSIGTGLERKDGSVLALSEDGRVLYLGTASGNGGSGVWRLGTPAEQAHLPMPTPSVSPTVALRTSAPQATGGLPPKGVPFGPCPTASLGLMMLALGLAWARRRM